MKRSAGEKGSGKGNAGVLALGGVLLLLLLGLTIPTALGYSFTIITIPPRVRYVGGDWAGPVTFNHHHHGYVVKHGRTLLLWFRRGDLGR